MPILSDSTVISEAEEVGVLHSTSQPGMLGQLVNLPVFDPTTISSEIEKYPQRQGFEIVELFFEVSRASFFLLVFKSLKLEYSKKIHKIYRAYRF